MSLGRIFYEFRFRVRRPTYCIFKSYMSSALTDKSALESVCAGEQDKSTEATETKRKVTSKKPRSKKPKTKAKEDLDLVSTTVLKTAKDDSTTNKSTVSEGVTKKEMLERTLESAHEDGILQFFNKCDHVTLTKLKKALPRIFSKADLSGLLEKDPYEAKTIFQDLESFLLQTKIDRSNLYAIFNEIERLRNKEKKTFGIPKIVPVVPMNSIKDAKYVVAVDVFMNNLSWAVMTQDRTLVNAGTTALIQNQYDYNTIKHQEMMSTILETVPPSALYLMSSRIPTKTIATWKYRPYQVLMEALLKMCLNHRMNLMLNTLDDSNKFNNFVYHVTLSDLDLFHKIVKNREMLVLTPLYNQWLKEDKGILRGMKTTISQSSFTPNEEVCKCIFLADMGSRCLAKTDEAFPSAYFT